MDTKFKVGDAVRSKVSDQGLKTDATYLVKEVRVTQTVFGTFTTYVLASEGGTRFFDVGNGHLVLEAATSRGPVVEAAMVKAALYIMRQHAGLTGDDAPLGRKTTATVKAYLRRAYHVDEAMADTAWLDAAQSFRKAVGS